MYFTASLRGKKVFGDKYEMIVKQLSQLGHKVFSDHILKNEFEAIEDQSREEARLNYNKLITEIKKTDIFVAEVSTQSLSVGHELTEAMSLNKPVVLLYTDDERPGLIFGSDYDKVIIVNYDKQDLKEKVARAITNAMAYADVRFNFFINPKLLNYLDWVAQERMIPRSVFLRDLIEKEMKKDKKFNSQ